MYMLYILDISRICSNHSSFSISIGFISDSSHIFLNSMHLFQIDIYYSHASISSISLCIPFSFELFISLHWNERNFVNICMPSFISYELFGTRSFTDENMYIHKHNYYYFFETLVFGQCTLYEPITTHIPY